MERAGALLLGISLFLIPLTRFVWDAWALDIFFCAACALLLIFIWSPAALGRGSRPHPAWTPLPRGEGERLSLILFSFLFVLSALRSPFAEQARNQSVLLAVCWIFYLSARSLTVPQKAWLQRAVCAGAALYCALYLALTVVNVHLLLRTEHLSETIEFFLNENVVAAFFLLSLGCALNLARSGKLADRAFAAASLLGLLLTRSVAAYAGAALMAGCLYLPRLRKLRRPYLWGGALLAALFLGLCLRYFLSLHSLGNRAVWWKGSAEMIREAPLLGHGPGSYERLSQGHPGRGMRSLYAHNFFLQTAAEAGVPAALAMMFFLIKGIYAHRENPLMFGVGAVVIQNLVDFSLSVPGILILSFTLLGMAEPPVPGGPGERASRKALLAAAASLGILVCAWKWGMRPALGRQESLKGEGAMDRGDYLAAKKHFLAAISWDSLPAVYHLQASKADDPKRP